MTMVTAGAWGTAGAGTPSSSLTMAFTTATTALSANTGFGVLIVVSENVATSDGETNLHTGITGGTGGTWTKLGEYTNGEGAAGAGATVSVWVFEAAAECPVGTSFTVSFASAITHKCASGHAFSKDSDKRIRLVPGAGRVFTVTDAVEGYGPSTISGLASQQYLFVRGLAKKTSNATNITPSSGFGTFTTARTATSNGWGVRGERRVNVSTGETSDPVYANTALSAGVFVVLEEHVPSAGGVSGGGAASTDISLEASGKVRAAATASLSHALFLAGQGTVDGEGSGGILGAFSSPLVLDLLAAGQSRITGVASQELDFGLMSSGSGLLRASADLVLELDLAASGSVPLGGEAFPTLRMTLAAHGTSSITGTGAGALSFALASTEPVSASLVRVLGIALSSEGTSVITGEGSGELGISLEAVAGVVLHGDFAGDLSFGLEAAGNTKARGTASLDLGISLWARGMARIPGLVILASMSREGEWKTRTRAGQVADRRLDGRWQDRMRTGTWG